MELKWLEDFVMLASTASFSRAAEARHVTQSAFSRRIKQLESWLGVVLVNRASLPAELTPEGRSFLPVAQDMIRTFYATRSALSPSRDQQGHQLTLAALQTLAMTYLPGWLAHLRRGLPELQTEIVPDRGGIEANLDALIDEEVDLFLTYAHPYVPLLLDPEQFDWLVLGIERVLPVVAPVLHPAAGGARGGALLRQATEARGDSDGDRAAVPYLDYSSASFFGTALQRVFFDNPRFERRILHRNPISASLRELALQGWGLCWQPESLVRDDLASGRLLHAGDGDPRWELRVEIRLYRLRRAGRPLIDRIWSETATRNPAGNPATTPTGIAAGIATEAHH